LSTFRLARNAALPHQDWWPSRSSVGFNAVGVSQGKFAGAIQKRSEKTVASLQGLLAMTPGNNVCERQASYQ
jgi:hypothetical protein